MLLAYPWSPFHDRLLVVGLDDFDEGGDGHTIVGRGEVSDFVREAAETSAPRKTLSGDARRVEVGGVTKVERVKINNSALFVFRSPFPVFATYFLGKLNTRCHEGTLAIGTGVGGVDGRRHLPDLVHVRHRC
jgi:hypothetical protein